MRRFIAVAVVLCLWAIIANQGIAAVIIPDVKKTVCFIFVDKGKGKPEANGTGFFVLTLKPDKTITHGYLVTAKHVLKPNPDQDVYYSEVVVRLTKRSGGVEGVRFPILTKGSNKTVFTHKDETVDIAVIPFLPKLERYDYKAITLDLTVTRSEFQKLNIGEGTDVFFAGMFTPHLGTEQNYPIVRFGCIALISNEKIQFMKRMRDLLLIDTFSFGGNSGSPVFVYLGAERQPGSLVIGPPLLKLVGIMSGTYRKGIPVEEIQTGTSKVSFDNMGIAAVVPTEYLKEILFSDELKKLRGY